LIDQINWLIVIKKKRNNWLIDQFAGKISN